MEQNHTFHGSAWGSVSVRWRDTVTLLLLAAVTLAVFWPVLDLGFVDYDDNLYVTENTLVREGLSWNGIVAAFTQANSNNYHPLTVISHMLDVELFGLRPLGHHVTNLLFHIVNVVLLFTVLVRMTGAFWRSLLVAALFGLHPLRVESVAWVAERKDVLSLFFGLLSILFYLRYAHLKEAKGPRREFVSTYLFSLFFFACALLSKPMLVTLPFMLLLLDFWPLNRLPLGDMSKSGGRSLRLLQEKLPFFLLIIPSVITTVWAQNAGGAIKSSAQIAFSLRLQNIPVAIAAYLYKTFWPTNLAVLYPYPPAYGFAKVCVAIIIVLVLTVSAIVFVRRLPFVTMGWLWFVGGLVPVLGIVQAGEQSMADRFVYWPSIGLLVAFVWSFAGVIPRKIVVPICVAVIAASSLVSRHQIQFWKDKYALFERAALVTSNNYVAHYNYADSLLTAGKVDQALYHYREAIRINPSRPEPRNNYAKALAQAGKDAEAVEEFLNLLEQHPSYAKGYSNFGAVLANLGRLDDATLSLQRAVQLDPKDAEAHVNLGNLYFRKKQHHEALQEYAAAIALNPLDATPHYWSGKLLLLTDPLSARDHYAAAVRLRPDWVAPMTEIAWLLATHPLPDVRDGLAALKYAQKASELTGQQDPKALAALEVAYAENKQFGDAIALAEREIKMAEQAGQPEKTDFLRKRIELYRSGKPFHQP